MDIYKSCGLGVIAGFPVVQLTGQTVESSFSIDKIELGLTVPIPTNPVLVSTYRSSVLTAKSPVVERLRLKLEPAAGVTVRAPEAVVMAGVERPVVKAGEVLNTATPVPVSLVKAVLRSAEVNEPSEASLPTLVTIPVRLALVVTLPAVSPEAVPVMLVPTRVEGVPRLGVVKTGEVKVLLVSVCVPPTVTTEAAFVPAVVTRKSPVPTVRIPAEWVATQSALAKCRVPPEARYKSDQPSAVVPRVAVSFVAGLAEVVKVEAPVTPRVLPRVVAPVMLAVPATVRREPGVVVPIPTFPALSTFIR